MRMSHGCLPGLVLLPSLPPAAAVMLRFRRKPPQPTPRAPARTTAKYGGMQVRELQTRLELLVNPTRRSHRGVHGAALVLAEYNLVEQNRFLKTLNRVAGLNAELAECFCRHAPPALGLLPEEAWLPWVEHILHTYAGTGLEAAIAAISDYSTYPGPLEDSPSGVAYADIAGIMEAFILGLSGRTLKLDTGESSYTDTETLYFPERICVYPDRDSNFQLYKACAAHQWAQTRFGTWDIDLQAAIASLADSERAIRLFHRLETLRLDACLARELPGVARAMQRFRPDSNEYPAAWLEAARCLAVPDADVEESLRWLPRLYELDQDPPAAAYEGILQPVAVRGVEDRRSVYRAGFQAYPTESGAELGTGDAASYDSAPQGQPPQTQELSGNDCEYKYDEWDEACQRYRKDWCRLKEEAPDAGPDTFRPDTLQKYHGLVSHLRRTFEGLRQDQRTARRETWGDDIDLDALVDALTDLHNGREMSDRTFTRTCRDQRSVAALFLLDMSASTRGWINDVERETLILLCEALELLGDRYAIYGFSGCGHDDCVSYPVKTFSEAYASPVWQRIGGIQARQHTRMGVAIRHHSAKLLNVDARTRLLIVLSDGRPDDRDGYRGAYGIEDTRKALMEARQAGIHAYCITIDTDAIDYLPHMFGERNFTVIDRVDSLPQRIGGIYRRLTT